MLNDNVVVGVGLANIFLDQF